MSKEFFQPQTLREALKFRNENKDTTLLAGGTDLLVAMNKGKSFETSFIDLSKVTEIKKIEILDDVIKIGSMVTFTDMEYSEILNSKAKILCKASRTVGSPQIRNRGTIGGNICNASPAADCVTPLVCLEAKVELQSMDTKGMIEARNMPLEEFIIGSNRILLKRNEILTGVIFKVPLSGSIMDFKKIGRRNALAIARVNGACVLKLQDNVISNIKIVIGSATSKPERFTVAEDYLRGRKLESRILIEAGILATDYVLKQTGKRSSSTYKLPVISRFTESLIKSALIEEGITI